MTTYLVRVWLPDRPGALGAVASRIGAVRGDLVGIDILERGAGRAIDELVVDLPSPDLVPLLAAEMRQVDGVDVEDIRPAPGSVHDPRLGALEAAAVLVRQETPEGLSTALCGHACDNFEAEWGVLLDHGAEAPLAFAGDPPPAPWLAAFVLGSRDAAEVAGTGAGPDDVAWAPLPAAGAVLALGRQGRPFRARERRQLDALAAIADARWSELSGRALPAAGAGRT